LVADFDDGSGDSATLATLRRYLHAMTNVVTRLHSLLDVDQVLATVVEALVNDFDAALARVWLFEPRSRILRLRASAGLSVAGDAQETIDLATHPHKIGAVARDKRPFISNALRGDAGFDQAWVEHEHLKSVAIFPLIVANEVRGVLAYFSRRPLEEGTVDVLAAFVATLTLSLSDAQLLARANAAREWAEAGQRRASFLAEAASALAAESDLDGALQALVRVAVPQLGDWCAIDLPAGKSGRGRRVAAAHIDPALAQLPLELQQRWPADMTAPAGFPHVLRTGQVEYWPEVPESMVRGAARDEEHLRIMRQLGFASYLCVPINVGGRVMGALTCVSARPERRFGPADLATAEELARRAAMALRTLSSAPGDGRETARAKQTNR
jgi:GAF domain-containing protein